MHSVNIERVYVIKKGDKQVVVELCRTVDGKLFIVPIEKLTHVYTTKDGEEKEWTYDTSKAEEIDYMSLPQNIRETISRLHVI